MRKIPVGTVVPGGDFLTWVPQILHEGFECFTVNFHMSLGGVRLQELAPKVRAMLDGTGIPVSALGFYCNPLMYEDHKAQLHECIDMASAFGTKVVSTFAGALEGESVDAAMPRFKEVFTELAHHAEDAGVKLAIENCPMGGTWQHTTCNIGFNPRAWDRMFEEVPSPALGLEWEPAHQICQLIDPIANLRKYAKKIHHLHGKDATVQRDLIADQGIISGEEAVVSRFPGLGDTDWRQVFTLLYANDFDGMLSIEGYHDPWFKGPLEKQGQIRAMKYLKWCRGDVE